ncbi:hypothetical protein BVX93_00620, partial [bacterium B13(2017)]
MISSFNYLPWWIGSIILSFISIGFWITNKKFFGVSGIITKIIFWKNEIYRQEQENNMPQTIKQLEKALMDATLKEFNTNIKIIDPQKPKNNIDINT